MTPTHQKPVTARDSIVTPKIQTPRQYRAVKYLAERQAATCFELQRIAGVRNAPELIRVLRKKRWHINCELFDVTDRDGKKTRPGRYRLVPEQIPIAKEVISEWEQSHDTQGT